MYCSAKQTPLPDRPSDHIVRSDRDRVFGSDGYGCKLVCGSVPTGAVIVADNGNSITVDFPAGAQTGDICVTAVNACGSSDPLCRTILVGGLYTRRIRGPQEVCRTDSSVTYYIPQVAGAVSYNWTIGGNAGMTVSGNNVTINFSSCTLNWVVLRVEVSNACGDVRSRSLWIHVRDCNGGGHDDDDDDDDDDDGDGHHGDDDRLLSPFANVAASLELQVFPNPSAGLFTVAVPEGYAGTVRVRVADLVVRSSTVLSKRLMQDRSSCRSTVMLLRRCLFPAR